MRIEGEKLHVEAVKVFSRSERRIMDPHGAVGAGIEPEPLGPRLEPLQAGSCRFNKMHVIQPVFGEYCFCTNSNFSSTYLAAHGAPE